MNTFCVYCHISPSNKKYVGISCDPQKRWASGRGYSKNYRFYRAIKKYGWDSFKHIIVADNLSTEDAKDMERKLISQWNLTDFKFGYNLREGGDGSFSPHSRELMSASRIGNTNCKGNHLSRETKNKISKSLSKYYSTHKNPFQGHRHSTETIKKLKGHTISDETKRRMSKNHADVTGAKNPSAKAIRQFNLNGTLVKEYPYATAAANELGVDLSTIIKCCRGKVKSCGGFRWEYVNQ